MDKLCRQSSTWRAETAVLMVGDHTGTIKTGVGTALYQSWNTSTNILQRLTLKVITNIASFFTSGALQKQNLSMPNMKIVESVGEVLLHSKDESIGEVLLQGKNTGGGGEGGDDVVLTSINTAVGRGGPTGQSSLATGAFCTCAGACLWLEEAQRTLCAGAEAVKGVGACLTRTCTNTTSDW